MTVSGSFLSKGSLSLSRQGAFVNSPPQRYPVVALLRAGCERPMGEQKLGEQNQTGVRLSGYHS